MTLGKATIINIHVPVSDVTVDKEKGLPNDPLLRRLVTHLGKSAPVGKLGNYSGVYELSFGYEGFVPGKHARPVKGVVGRAEICASARFRTYAESGVTAAQIAKYCREVSAMHPWEHPVIEVYQGAPCKLWTPPRRKRGA